MIGKMAYFPKKIFKLNNFTVYIFITEKYIFL